MVWTACRGIRRAMRQDECLYELSKVYTNARLKSVKEDDLSINSMSVRLSRRMFYHM